MRNIAETGLKSLFMRMIYLNQKYVDHDQIVRLTNKDITVNKENLSGNFDYIVNAGMGAGAKETDIQNIMQVNQVMPTLIQAGLATLKNAYNAQKKWLELIGIRNIDDYLQDPDQNQQPPQQQDEKKISESIQAKITDAPWQIQMQHWAKLGYQVTPEMFIQKQQMELDIKRQEPESKANADMNKTITQAKIQDHHADKLHQHSMEAANLNNSARERQMTLNAEITRNNQQGAARAGGQEVPGRDIQGSPAGYSRQGVL
jgi:hypothetical protein